MKRRLGKRLSAFALAGALSLMTAGFDAYADYSDEIDELESRQWELANELEDIEYQLRQYENDAKEHARYLELYNDKMEKQEEEIKNLREQIRQLGVRIKDTEHRIEEKQEEVDNDIVDFKHRLRVMYMQGGDSLASMLVGATDFYDILVRTELMERISRHDHEMIEDLTYKINTLNSQKAQLEQNKTDLEGKREEAEDVLAELQQTYRDHEETKAFLEAKAEAARDMTWEMKEEQESVEADLAMYIRLQQEENERRRQEEEEEERRREQQRREEEERRREEERSYSRDDTDYTYLAGSADLIWPCPNVWNITDGYGWRSIAEEGGSSDFHGGIDINKPGCYGETIVASASGTVITAGNTGNGYGIHVVIDHGGGISTLYGHMSSCTVSSGDYVSQGETIGYIGSTGYAYGNHCHFEVREYGERTDPLNYVSY